MQQLGALLFEVEVVLELYAILGCRNATDYQLK